LKTELRDWPIERETVEMRLTMMRRPEKFPGPESEAATAGTGLVGREEA